MTALTFFTLTGTYLPDSSLGVVSGTATISMLVNVGDVLAAPTIPGIVVPTVIPAKIINGQLCDQSGQPGVQLVANTSVLNLSGSLFYTVTFDVNYHPHGHPPESVEINPFTFTAPTSAVTIDLSTVTPAAGVVAGQVPSVLSVNITDATTIGREVLTAATETSARGDIGAAGYLGSVASQSAMNALTANVGDYCFRSDLGLFYCLIPGNTWAGGISVPITESELAAAVQSDLTLAATALQSIAAGTDITVSGNTVSLSSAAQTALAEAATALQSLSAGTDITVSGNQISLSSGAQSALALANSALQSIVAGADITVTGNTVALSSAAQTALGLASTALQTSAIVDNADGTLSINSITTLEPLSTTVIRTASTAPVIGQTTYYNAASSNLTPTLPALSGLRVGARLAYRRDPADLSAHTVTISCAAGDTFYSSGATAATVPMFGEQVEIQVISVSGTKYWAPSGSIKPTASLDQRYSPGASPADYGWAGWSHDLAACNTTGVAPANGLVYLVLLPLRIKQTITNITLGVSVAGASLTSGENFAGLYQNGSLLSSTADQSTAWQSTGLKTMALSTPQLVDPANGTIYAAFYANGTTRPTFIQAAIGGTGVIVASSTFKRYVNDLTNTGRTTSLQSTLGTLSATSPMWAAWS